MGEPRAIPETNRRTANPKRHWFRFAFSLKALFAALTLIGIYFGLRVSIVYQRQAFVESIGGNDPMYCRTFRHWDECTTWNGTPPAQRMSDSRDGRPYSPERDRIPLWRRWLGDEAVKVITLPLDEPPGALENAKELFPEAEIRQTSIYSIDSIFPKAP